MNDVFILVVCTISRKHLEKQVVDELISKIPKSLAGSNLLINALWLWTCLNYSQVRRQQTYLKYCACHSLGANVVALTTDKNTH